MSISNMSSKKKEARDGRWSRKDGVGVGVGCRGDARASGIDCAAAAIAPMTMTNSPACGWLILEWVGNVYRC